MIKYQYQILRYLHDQVTQEFVNIGVIVFEPNSKFLDSRVISRYSRIADFFGVDNGSQLVKILKIFQKKIDSAKIDLKDELGFVDSIDIITSNILPKDDSSLILTPVKFAIELDLTNALENLFERLVEKYTGERQSKVTDQDVWRSVYKSYFDSQGITQNLVSHRVEANSTDIQFDKAWKNGAWHVYQPLAFNLKKVDSIQTKAFKWSGIIKALEAQKERMNLYFLTTSPKEEQSNLRDFIHKTLLQSTNKIHVEIIEEKDAEEFAARVKEDMNKSHD